MSTIGMQPELSDGQSAADARLACGECHRIEAGRLFGALRPGELWRHRHLVWMLAVRDVKVRYKQTALGGLWAVAQPLATMAALSLLLGGVLGVSNRVAQMEGGVSSGAYPMFLLAGLLPWGFFAAIVTGVGNCLLANAVMIQKVYFPRLALPVASLGAPAMDLGICVLVMLGMGLWYGVAWGASMLLIPMAAATVGMAGLGVGLLLAGLTVRWRDLRIVTPFILQIGFFASPVIYPASVADGRAGGWVWLNPLWGSIEAFRRAALGMEMDWNGWGISAAVSAGLLLIGWFIFAAAERRLADEL